MARRTLRDKVTAWFASVLGLDEGADTSQLVTDEDGFVWTDVESSNVEAIGWREDDRTLAIRFGVDKPPTTYRYPDFPRAVMEEFMEAGSKGSFVWYSIRNSGADDLYPFVGPL